jgi:hypothetical protein
VDISLVFCKSQRGFLPPWRFSPAAVPLICGFASIAIPEECTALTAWQAKVQERASVKNPA